MAYIGGDRPSEEAGEGCPFCAAPGRGDTEGLVVHRGDLCYVVMNLFPYNPGHVLVCPYRHVSLYVELTDEETTEFTALTKQAIAALTASSGPMGFNLGMNQGAVAGAGVAAHLHQHIVPRWGGDSNFLPVIAQTKALPMLLEDVRSRLVASWPSQPGH
jgi:ATP adenylyltransferase